METIIERKCWHEKEVTVHRFQAEVEVVIKIRRKVKGSFNANYKSGMEVAEELAIDETWDEIPQGWDVSSKDLDAFCVRGTYELLDSEPEVDRD